VRKGEGRAASARDSAPSHFVARALIRSVAYFFSSVCSFCRLDECAESILLFFVELQSHPSHPRSPTLVRAAAGVLAEWMADDGETHQGESTAEEE
jgi:hypothetical protein